MIKADSELRYLKGVGPRRAVALAKQALETVEDLLYLLPFRYEDRRSFARIADLRPGQAECTLSVHVDEARLIHTRRRGFKIFEAVLSDDSGSVKAVWYNQAFLERVIKPGRRAVLFGRMTLNRYGKPVLENPDYEFLEEEDAPGIHTGRIVPVYRKTGDLSPRVLRQLIHRALADLEPRSLPEVVPPEVSKNRGLLPRCQALRLTHFPPPEARPADLEERRTAAQRSLIFEEIFLLQLALALRRHVHRQRERGIVYELPDALRTRLGRMLPFKLTRAQKRVVREIAADLKSPRPMNRLLQGDVGSGKTIVALLALMVAVENGYQGALMAPTEILVEQHFRNIRGFLEGGGIDCPVALLTGSMRAAQRRAALEAIREGEAKLVLGTHALFEEGVEFRDLGLAVIDEQHRFGVLQRAALAAKGSHPDVLVMTATPIPRSMALTLYGDLDLSIIDELPPGRTPVRTVTRTEERRAKVYDGVRQEVRKGRQVYVVVPLVEETARSDLKAATEFAEHLRSEVFPEFAVGMVHGRMKGPEKDETMRAFAGRGIQILVATTVIEVGVDVANATVMVVEHAERFGLSQLHQLRGRVGRGADLSYCVLMVGEEGRGPEARERLAVMEETSDGFKIAEKDLELRGPGVVFGTQQHGLSDLQFLGEVLRSPAMLESARNEARRLVEGGTASLRRAREILDGLPRRWQKRLDLIRVG